jgi:hypothetical protein
MRTPRHTGGLGGLRERVPRVADAHAEGMPHARRGAIEKVRPARHDLKTQKGR